MCWADSNTLLLLLLLLRGTMPEQLDGVRFCMACAFGERERVEGHVDADGPIDIRDGCGATGLMHAAREGRRTWWGIWWATGPM